MKAATRILMSLVVIAALPFAGATGQVIDPRPGSPGVVPTPTSPMAGRRSPIPMAPALMEPAAGAVVGAPGIPTVQLAWNQGGASLTRYLPAQHFVVCLATSTPAPPCTWPGQFRLAVGSLPSEPYVHPTFGPQPVTRVYRHAIPASASATFLDRDVTWTVGACTSTTTASCAFSRPAGFYWSSRNLTPPQFTSRLSISQGDLGGWRLDVATTNDGQSESGPFRARIELLESLQDATGNCLRDANAESVQATDEVVRRDGSRVTAGSLPRDSAGRRVAADVVGIVRRPGVALLSNPTVHSAPSAPPRTDVPSMVARDAIFTFSWNASPASPKRFVAVSMLDTERSVREFDERDNGAARCLDALHRL